MMSSFFWEIPNTSDNRVEQLPDIPRLIFIQLTNHLSWRNRVTFNQVFKLIYWGHLDYLFFLTVLCQGRNIWNGLSGNYLFPAGLKQTFGKCLQELVWNDLRCMHVVYSCSHVSSCIMVEHPPICVMYYSSGDVKNTLDIVCLQKPTAWYL